MSNLIRWEPMREMVTLREAMDRLFDDAFTRPWGMADGMHASSIPAVDLYQTDNEVVVKAALPGMKADDIQINLTGQILTLKGEVERTNEVDEKNDHIREERWGAFERSVELPTIVVSDNAKAEFENGVLTLTLPKADQALPKMITIKAK
jgi:HSP20 family protein